MAIDKRVSIKEIIAKVYRDLQLTDEVNWEDMIEWCGEALEHIGTFGQTENKICEMDVENGRVNLPCDFLQVLQISYGGNPLARASSTFGNYASSGSIEATDQTSVDNIGTNNLVDPMYIGHETYTIDSAYIKTSFTTGTIIMSYTAFPIDAEGFPEVPDDISFREALFNYIVKKLKYIDYLNGQMPRRVYLDLERAWEFSCKQAAAKMQMPTIDQMENMKNWNTRLLPQIDDWSGYFVDLGSRQRLNK
jgi:hypothetical protein